MKGLFCNTVAQTNEAYKEVVKMRMRRFAVIMVLGIVTGGAGFYIHFAGIQIIDDHMLGVYSGAGTGLFMAGLVLWIKNKMLLANDEKLKESRLNNSDERILEISSKAFKTASFFLLVALYLVGLIGGLFNPVLMKVLFGLVMLFTVTYTASFKWFESKMK